MVKEDFLREDGHFYCDYCSYRTNNFVNLRQHRKYHVGGLSCTICSRMFPWKKNLERHMNTHKNELNKVNEEQHKCFECQGSFATILLLKKHYMQFHPEHDPNLAVSDVAVDIIIPDEPNSILPDIDEEATQDAEVFF